MELGSKATYGPLELLLARIWTASVYLPLAAEFAVGDSEHPVDTAGLGYVEASADWTDRASDTRVFT